MLRVYGSAKGGGEVLQLINRRRSMPSPYEDTGYSPSTRSTRKSWAGSRIARTAASSSEFKPPEITVLIHIHKLACPEFKRLGLFKSTEHASTLCSYFGA